MQPDEHEHLDDVYDDDDDAFETQPPPTKHPRLAAAEAAASSVAKPPFAAGSSGGSVPNYLMGSGLSCQAELTRADASNAIRGSARDANRVRYSEWLMGRKQPPAQPECDDRYTVISVHVLDQRHAGARFTWHRDTEEDTAQTRVVYSCVVLLLKLQSCTKN